MSSALRNGLNAISAGLFLAMGAGALDATAAVAPGHRDAAPALLVQVQTTQPRKVFHAVGVVTATKPAGSLTINHQPIEGLMPAMEMMFSVKPRSLSDGVHPGDKVEFEVEGATYTIVGLKVVGHTR